MSSAHPTFIARWDLDKTYLRTEFDTLRDLVRTAMERADEKRAVPGASATLRELGKSGVRIHILSGSPRQMKRRLEEKLRLDRVRWDELTLKPNLSNLLRLRMAAVRDQLGYKLPALLEARVRDQRLGASGMVHEVLLGDDAEADAFVYSLYADVCEGEVSRRVLEQVLAKGRVYADQAERCLAAFDSIRHGPTVRRILIHLDRQTRPSLFDTYGPRVVPFYNYLQAALVLAEDGVIDEHGVTRVALEFALKNRFDGDQLARSYLDLRRRGHAEGTLTARLSRASEATLPPHPALAEMCAILSSSALQAESASRRKRLDYLELADRHRAGKNRGAKLW